MVNGNPVRFAKFLLIRRALLPCPMMLAPHHIGARVCRSWRGATSTQSRAALWEARQFPLLCDGWGRRPLRRLLFDL